jgi:hypothetical protein
MESTWELERGFERLGGLGNQACSTLRAGGERNYKISARGVPRVSSHQGYAKVCEMAARALTDPEAERSMRTVAQFFDNEAGRG